MVKSEEAVKYLTKKCKDIIARYINDYFHINLHVSLCVDNDEKLCEDEYLKCYFEEENKIVAEALKSAKNASKEAQKKNMEDLIMGKPFKDTPVSIASIAEDSGRVAIQGCIFNTEIKTLNNGKTIISFNITDNTNSITAKICKGRK